MVMRSLRQTDVRQDWRWLTAAERATRRKLAIDARAQFDNSRELVLVDHGVVQDVAHEILIALGPRDRGAQQHS